MNNNIILEMKGISKKFPGVLALDNVDFELMKGEVHALLGENGAGKSTLIKVLSGAHQKDKGRLFLENNEIDIHSPRHAQDLGISVIYQEFNLIPDLTVAENIFLGRESTSNNLIKDNEMTEKSRELLKQLHIDLDPSIKVSKLGVAMQQMVEVVKAISMDSEILVMDEPTAALGEHETEQLFLTVKRLKARGISIIYISHRLEELWEVADRATVLRDGQYISTHQISETDEDTLIKDMVGRTLSKQFPYKDNRQSEEVLRVEGITQKNNLNDISFNLYKGEVLGFAGLIGAGRTELMRCLFGADNYDKGNIFVDDRLVKIESPQDAIKQGIGFITEDRKNQGLILNRPVDENVTITDIDQVMKGLFIKKSMEEKLVNKYIANLKIKTPGLKQEVRFLSGGNQQKVVLAKWLLSKSKILIFDEPTRGIDVGAKKEVYELMNKLTENGVAIIMISSELPEILGMSDRIIVMSHGKLTGEFQKEDVGQEKILKYATKE